MVINFRNFIVADSQNCLAVKACGWPHRTLSSLHRRIDLHLNVRTQVSN